MRGGLEGIEIAGRGEIEEGRIKLRGLAEEVGDISARLRIGEKRIGIEGMRIGELLRGEGEIRWERGEGYRLELGFSSPKIEGLARLGGYELPEGLEGEIEGEIRGRGNPSSPLEGEIRISSLRVRRGEIEVKNKGEMRIGIGGERIWLEAVSYTHLTLPTIYSV